MQHLTAQAKQRRWQGIFVSGILIVVARVGLAACNYTVSAQNSSAAQAQVNQTGTPEPPIRPTPSPTRGTGAAPAACGVVNGYGSLKVVPKDQGAAQAENCFWQAFQRCQAATLVFLTSGVGKGITNQTFKRTFTIHQENGACVISDARQEGPALNALQPATTFTCTGLVRQPGALDVLSCGQDGTIHVLGF